MLTPRYLEQVSEPVVGIFAQVQEDIYSNITRKVVKLGKITEPIEWQIQKSLEWGALRGDVKKVLRKAGITSNKEVNRILREAAEEAIASDGKIYAQAGLKLTGLTSNPAFMAVVLQGITDTNFLLGNFTRTTADVADKAFVNSVDRAFLQVMSGAFSPTEAIHRAIRDLASQGLERVGYPSGRMNSLESSVRRAVITGTNQATAKLQMAVMDDLNVDLVEVTSHGGARPSHAEWQGQIYSRSGKHKKYPDFVQSTGYGTGPGLCGWNCYHNFFPFFEGISTPAFSKDPSADAGGKSNDEIYLEQQQQRKIEREIRKAKQEVVTYKTARDSASSDDKLRSEFQNDFEQSSVKLKKARDKMKNFLKDTGRGQEPEREMVAGFDRSASSSAVWAAKRSDNR